MWLHVRWKRCGSWTLCSASKNRMCNGWRDMESQREIMKTVIALEKKFMKTLLIWTDLNLKCRSITNSLCVCKWFEWIGHNTVTGFCHGCTHTDHRWESLQAYLGENEKTPLPEWTWRLHYVSAVLPNAHDQYLRQNTPVKVESAFRPTKKVNLYVIELFLEKQR